MTSPHRRPEILSEVARDDRVQIYIAAVKAGGLLCTPVDVTLDVLPEDAFATARDLLVLLRDAQNQTTGLELSSTQIEDGYAYQVRHGKRDWKDTDLVPIFQGTAGRAHPVPVEALEKLLKHHARPQDFHLKP